MTGLYYWPGDRIITAVDKSTRNISTKAGQIQWQLKGITHIEEGTSDDPLRAVMIELKGDGPSHKVEKANGVPAFTGSAMPLLDNERVTVWDYAKAASASHSHPMDTFVVWTEGRAGHAVFLPAAPCTRRSRSARRRKRRSSSSSSATARRSAVGAKAAAERHSTRVQRRSRPIWCNTTAVAFPCASRSNVICASTAV